MAHSLHNIKNPPPLNENTSYESWEKELDLWVLLTDIPVEKQGPAVVLSLCPRDKEKVLELTTAEIVSKECIINIKRKLETIYKKDSVDLAYETFEKFIYFKRDQTKCMNEYVLEFERRYSKAKKYGFVLPESALAFFLLDRCHLSDSHKRLIKATITVLNFEDMKSKLLKVFGGPRASTDTEDSMDEVKVKFEDINVCDEEAYYGYNNYNYDRRGFRPNRGNFSNRRMGRYNPRPFDNSWRSSGRGAQAGNFSKRKCEICESTYHQTFRCPEKIYYNEEDGEENHEVVLYQSNLILEEDYKVFVAESSISAILDCGASSTVAGKDWFQSYIEGLSEQQKKGVIYEKSCAVFKFGCDKRYKSLFKATIPATIGTNEVKIKTDVVNTTIPLLLSKQSMKQADTNMDFKTDEVTMFGEVQDVKLTKSGHYAVSLNKSEKILDSLNYNENAFITLVATKEDIFKDKEKVASKLHAQFGHPVAKRLVRLVKRAGREHDTELIEKIHDVSKNCKICTEYKQPSPRPIVSLPHSSKFNETVALDLKFFRGKIILHMIDTLTRFSSAIICKSKEASCIIEGIVRCWIAIFGPPDKVIVDNGGEFANSKFIEMAESMNIRVVTTPAFSPWSNGVVERHNGVLAETLNKMMEESDGDIHLALAWAINAKNSLANVHGFSPAQLAIGKNPQLPGILNDSLPA